MDCVIDATTATLAICRLPIAICDVPFAICYLPFAIFCLPFVVCCLPFAIQEIRLPKRSPDLSVLDYCLWHEVNKRMRQQERKFRPSFKESEEAFKKHLRRTALGLPKSLVSRAVGDMAERLALIKKAKGGLIDE